MQVNKLVRQWEAADRQMKPESAMLTWHVKPPGVFMNETVGERFMN